MFDDVAVARVMYACMHMMVTPRRCDGKTNEFDMKGMIWLHELK